MKGLIFLLLCFGIGGGTAYLIEKIFIQRALEKRVRTRTDYKD